MKEAIQTLLDQQLPSWEMAKNNYEALKQVKEKEVVVNGSRYKVQFNPARIVSSAAKVDTKSIQERKCFLCPANLPPMQKGIPFNGHYQILVNPFPIFPKHLTVPELEHTDQRILQRFGDMLDLAASAEEYVVFYNGPKCGASAPDHAHFQAGNKGFLPIESEWKQKKGEKVAELPGGTLWTLDDAPRTTLLIEASNKTDAMTLFGTVYKAMELKPGEEEPMMNVLAWVEAGKWIVCIFPRDKHRPSCYTAEGDANILISPASVDMGGVFITPLEKDFEKMTANDMADILSEVCMNKADFRKLIETIAQHTPIYAGKAPKVHVGILFEPQIEFNLLNRYRIHGKEVSGKQVVTYQEGRISWQGELYDELLFEPIHEETDAFELMDVTIGINFHWQRKENQRFLGALKIIIEEEKLTGINVINVEDYLTSVISSEMSATASLELLKAHAVISRSWLLANSGLTPNLSPKERGVDHSTIRWYERDAHTRFNVCADDHCQRYQGITRASTEIVKQAIQATRGQVLMFDGKICDARFSKCCGGAFEEFQYCWEDVQHPYLMKQRDSKTETTLPDLQVEAEAEKWIRTSPEAFCNTKEGKVLSQVLNNYDQETTDFYRWKVTYNQQELAELIKQRSGVDYGQIIDLIPVARGTSGRLWKLKIVGTKRTMTIGKELEIRRTLSTSHLYSSAFVVDKVAIKEGIPEQFILTGAGWGHGVGLCQIGAAVMGEQGYKYDEILLHYYHGRPQPLSPSPNEREKESSSNNKETEIVTLYE